MTDQAGSISIGDRTITSLRFADDIVVLTGDDVGTSKNHHFTGLHNGNLCREKTKLMTSNVNGISSNIMVNSQSVDTVGSFKNLCTT